MAEFYAQLFNNFSTYAIILLLVIIILYLIFRTHIFSIFDPLFYLIIINEGFCIADVIFMFHYGMIENRYFLNFLFTEIAFCWGILQFKHTTLLPSDDHDEELPSGLRATYRVSIILFVCLNVLIYIQRGIPLFMESRLETYNVGGGWGLIGRIFDILPVVIIFYLMEVFRRRNWQLHEWSAFIIVIAIQMLTGAKNSILLLVFMVSLHGFYTGAWSRVGAKSLRFLSRLTAVAIGGFLLVAQIQSIDQDSGGAKLPILGQASLRLVNNGDSLIYAYPNQFIEQLDRSNPFGAVLREDLAFFRLKRPDQLPTHLGVQITKAFYGSNSINQTNARHNIFNYVYFGFFGSILASYLMGSSLGFIRYRLIKKSPRNWVLGISYIILNLAFYNAATDWDGTSRGILDVVVLFLPMILLIKLFINKNHNFKLPE